MKKILSRGLIFAGALTMPIAVSNPESPSPATEYRNDPRLFSLKRFFQECPARALAAEFLHAADQHHLDWRLLPSISVVESSGGRAARNNNLFGWDSGNASFTSARAAIYEMARNLTTSKLYRDKDIDQILETYNPNANYPTVVKSVMRRISKSDKLEE